jgi:GNAT superfamily N-acetyltransferase
MSKPYPFADVALSKRLELAEAHSCSRFVESRAQVDPASGATWIEVAGARAMFDGVSSPVTQSFGLGIAQTPTAADFDALEAFFHDRGAAADHEVSPLADPATLALLNERGYRPIEFTSVMFRPIDSSAAQRPAGSTVIARLIDASEAERWSQVSAEGWRDLGAADFVLNIGRVHANAPGTKLFLAEFDGTPIAAAALNLSEGVAHLAGASTVPAGRKQGAQLALLDARLRYAADHGCDLALMGAAPGSGSQRNAERHGFRIAYTRTKWRLKR